MNKYVVSNMTDGAGADFPRHETLSAAIDAASELYRIHYIPMAVSPVVNEVDFECGDVVALIYQGKVWKASDE